MDTEKTVDTEVTEAVAEAVNNSNQKASALMTQLKNAGINWRR